MRIPPLPSLMTPMILALFTVSVPGQMTPEEANTIEVFRKAAPAIVHVRASHRASPDSNSAISTLGTGSGFLIDRIGHVLTNYHVISGSDSLELLMGTGRVLAAELIGTAPAFDIALLKAELPSPLPEDLRTLPLGDSSSVKVGQKMLAIGNPLGFHNTLTVGIVSGLARDIPGAPPGLGHEFIQTDTAINPGNSGGPLLHSGGHAVGINTVVVQEGQNISFAIPIDLVKKALPDLIRMGHVYRPLLGFTAMPVSPRMAALFGLPAKAGLLVQEVTPGSPAELAGLRAGSRMVPMNETVYVIGGDIIVAIDQRDVTSPLGLTKSFLGSKPGDILRLTVLRAEGRKEVELVLPPMHY